MALLDQFRPVAALNTLLERERAVILKGEFDKLEHFIKAKETLLPLVAKSNASERTLAALRKESERNQALFRAASKGVKAAALRLRTLRDSSQSFTAYGPNGAATSIGHKSLSLKRKA
ncbi:hypothetical protein [Celeribacter litoreus]|uniref:hypothetical protein n=1 Tax=Celeribacter litoreus TaxID=2876714 RepID=UPI001CCDDAAD|nr:hypothetical protein [Celeribacter litoreus]MCA0044248.1 hypothetical protein [Celeribacter litoreus]